MFLTVHITVYMCNAELKGYLLRQRGKAYLTYVQSPSVLHTSCIDSRSQNL